MFYLPPPSPTPSDEAEDDEGFVRTVSLDAMMDAHQSRMNKAMDARIVPKSKMLIARGLPLDVSMPQLRALFGAYGPLRGTYLPRNMDPGADDYGVIKGYAHITFMWHEDAVRAFRALYGQFYLRGEYVELEFARQ